MPHFRDKRRKFDFLLQILSQILRLILETTVIITKSLYNFYEPLIFLKKSTHTHTPAPPPQQTTFGRARVWPQF
jgi:hypothetical protein